MLLQKLKLLNGTFLWMVCNSSYYEHFDVYCAHLSNFMFDVGCVTDHCNLLEEHSRLFHHLSVFEKDLKRRVAMQNKRLDLLQPILQTLNRNAFEGLHKQASYEMGEIFVSLGDLMSEKYANGRNMKKTDIVKSNEYCLGEAITTMPYRARINDSFFRLFFFLY